MKCPNCNSNNSIKDASRGDTICGDCGNVLEENEVVCDVAFENTKVVGSFVTDQIGGFSFSKNKHGNPMIDSSEIRRSKAYNEIQKLASNLLINHYMVDMAKKYYNLASARRFIQGRKTKHVVGVILYTVCRLQKTRHLLIDFSEVLQANLFVLGSIYLKFIRLLQINVPIVDPSLFIKRFCAKLEFSDKTNLVSSTALKIMQCMDRDWMTTGRRPSGLCGAAIIISARIHGFKRSTKQITDVVHVCDETIRRRLEEFSTTSTARMQKIDFDCADKIIDDGQGKDPPAYIKNRKREKENQEQIVNKEILYKQAKEIEKIFSYDKNEKLIKNDSDIGTTLEQTLVDNTYLNEKKSELIKQTYISNNSNSIQFQSSSLKKSQHVENEDLSDIEDVSNFIVTQDEYKLKKLLWEILFKDWIEEQKEKKKAEKKHVKKRIRKLSKLDTTISRDPVEAIKNSNKFGKKINLNLLNNMFKNK